MRTYASVQSCCIASCSLYAQDCRGERIFFHWRSYGSPFQNNGTAKIIPRSFFLVRGYGKKQEELHGVVPCFNDDGYGAIVNSSSDIDFAWQEEQNPSDFVGASRRKTQSMIEDICGALRDSGKIVKAWKM